MNKKELIKKLVQLGYKENEIKGLTINELRKIYKDANEEVKDVIEEEAISEVEQADEEEETAVEDTDEVIADEEILSTAESVSVEGELIEETEVQPKVNEVMVYNFRHDATKTTIENTGGGDVYVSTDMHRITKYDILRPQEGVQLCNERGVLIRSASRPVIRIRQYR